MALVLRTTNLGEADRIITFIGRSRGKIRAVARGVRRTSSKFGGRLEPFSVIDGQFHEGRSLDTVTQVSSIAALGTTLASNYDTYADASIIAELADRLTDEEPAEPLFLLTVGALRTLAAHEHRASTVSDSYVVRALAIAGWQPAIDECVVCGRSDVVAFAPQAGGALCPEHSRAGAARFDAQQQEYLQALLDGNWALIGAAPQSVVTRVGGLVAAFMQFQLERQVRSLRR